MKNEEIILEDLAASFQTSAVTVLVDKTINAQKDIMLNI